jgi:hypothetical protein
MWTGRHGVGRHRPPTTAALGDPTPPVEARPRSVRQRPGAELGVIRSVLITVAFAMIVFINQEAC